MQNICAKQPHTDLLTYNSYNCSLNNFKWVFAVPKRGQTDRNKTRRVKAKNKNKKRTCWYVWEWAMAQITTHLALSHRLITQRQGTRAVWLLLTASVGFLAGESIENILKTTCFIIQATWTRIKSIREDLHFMTFTISSATCIYSDTDSEMRLFRQEYTVITACFSLSFFLKFFSVW